MNELQTNNPEMGMKDFLAVLRRRFWVILPILALCVGGAYFWTLKTQKTWRAEAQMMLVQRPPSSGNSADSVAPQAIESMETQVGMINSVAMAQKTLEWLKNDAYYKSHSSEVPFTLDDIQNGVKVINPLDSNLLDVSADANSQAQSIALANSVAHAFVEWKHDIAQEDIVQQEIGLRLKVAKARQAMLQAQQKEATFKQTYQLADLDTQERASIEQFTNSDSTVAVIKQDLEAQKARVVALDAQLAAANKAVMSVNGVADPGAVEGLQAQINQLKADRADAGTKYTSSFPGAPGIPSLADLDGQIKNKQAQLDRALKAATNNDAPSLVARGNLAQMDGDAHVQEALTQAKLASAVQSRETYQQTKEGMPGLRLQYSQLLLNRELATGLYTSLQTALNAIRLEKDKVSGNIEITQGAIAPDLPYKPNLKTNLLLGFAIGALLSLGLVMLLEQLDQRVRTLDEVRALSAGPIIGMLPKTSRSRMNALTSGALLPEFEDAFNLVRVNLSYVMRHSLMREDSQPEIILVTSAMPGEGKSVTAAQLARSMADTGKSVILVDANLRRPVQNVLFQTGETGGLTDVLSGQMPLDEAIATSNIAGLSILSSGVTQQNPTTLLSHPRLAAVMEALRFKADVVIVDGPDCTSAADTLLLTAHADCLLQVVRVGMVDMDTLHNASLALQATGKKVTILTNGLTRPMQRTFKSRFAYAALSSQTRTETPALPQSFDKTMVMNRSHDLVFSKSSTKSLDTPVDAPEAKDEIL